MGLRPWWTRELSTLWVCDLERAAPALVSPCRAAIFQELEGPMREQIARVMGLADLHPVLERLQAGRRCFVAIVDGRIASYAWVSSGCEHVGGACLRPSQRRLLHLGLRHRTRSPWAPSVHRATQSPAVLVQRRGRSSRVDWRVTRQSLLDARNSSRRLQSSAHDLLPPSGALALHAACPPSLYASAACRRRRPPDRPTG
jgi:hypothetical protein